jgi:hypothetical protein
MKPAAPVTATRLVTTSTPPQVASWERTEYRTVFGIAHEGVLVEATHLVISASVISSRPVRAV